MECENYFADELKSNPLSEKSLPCFDCSICLDFAKDPVVTLCGHLYCWPCIYKWLSFQTTSTDSHDNPLCPVCKSEISHTSVVPLYGRGKTLSDNELNSSTVVPPRPRATLVTASNPNQQFTYRNSHQTPYANYGSSPGLFSHGVRTAPMYGSNPNLWMYGEMILRLGVREFGEFVHISKLISPSWEEQPQIEKARNAGSRVFKQINSFPLLLLLLVPFALLAFVGLGILVFLHIFV